MTETTTDTLDKTRPFPDAGEVERLLASVEASLEQCNHKRTIRRRRNRRIAWSASGAAALALAALVVTGGLTPIVSIFNPDVGSRVYLKIVCYGGDAPGTEFSNANNDAAMRAQRVDAGGVCTGMAQEAALQSRLVQLDNRPDVQAAGSAVVYATNGSVWQMYKYDGGWSIDGGPDPVPAIGYPRPAQTPFVPDHVGPKTIIIRNFSLDLPPVKPQAVCVKTDVEFDVYGMPAGQSADAVCAAHGLDAQN
jgi:hypothetical protein